MTTPQWLQECPLEPIPPVDMKTVWIGRVKAKETPLAHRFRDKEQMVSIHVEVDKYFEVGYRYY